MHIRYKHVQHTHIQIYNMHEWAKFGSGLGEMIRVDDVNLLTRLRLQFSFFSVGESLNYISLYY